jgi:hypothetical protein
MANFVVHFGREPGGRLEDKGPLARRAWTYQESFLARRYISFTPKELRWRCLDGLRCECRTWDHVEDVGARVHHPVEHTLYTISNDIPRSDLYRIWYCDIVPEYTKRELTNLSDRLPAISAIANYFQGRIPDSYLAGIWRQEIVRGLLWQIHSWNKPGSASPLYRAPSWTWASIDGPISYPKYHEIERYMEISVNVTDAHCTLLSGDPTGAVAAGHLTLEGEMRLGTVLLPSTGATDCFELQVHFEKPPSETAQWGSGYTRYYMRQDCPLEISRTKTATDPQHTAKRSLNNALPASVEMSGHRKATSRDVSQVEARVWCLIIGKTDHVWFGLVLAESEDHPGSYVRLGLMVGNNYNLPMLPCGIKRTITIF